MANTKITSRVIADDAVTTAAIADDAITSAKIADNPTFSGTESITIPSGTTAQRASSPANGMIRYNTTESTMESYIAGQWQEMQSQGYPYTLEYVVVAGGGAGGTGAFGDAAGGAGGGGYRSSVSGESSIVPAQLNTAYGLTFEKLDEYGWLT